MRNEYLHGDGMSPALLEEIAALIQREPHRGCLLWTGYVKGTTPYHRGQSVKHLLWEHYNDPLNEGDKLMRDCASAECVNPKHHHVRPKSLTHCINGHAYTPENTKLNEKGYKVCRTCLRKHFNEYRQRRRQRSDPEAWLNPQPKTHRTHRGD